VGALMFSVGGCDKRLAKADGVDASASKREGTRGVHTLSLATRNGTGVRPMNGVGTRAMNTSWGLTRAWTHAEE
jgi:hypothetical protein